MSTLIKLVFRPTHKDARPHEFLRHCHWIAYGSSDLERVNVYVDELDFGRFLDSMPRAADYGLRYEMKANSTDFDRVKG